MRLIDADALIEVVEKSMAENPHKEKTQRAMHIHEHKYFLTLLAGIPTIQPVATDTNDGDTISRQQAIDIERNATVDTNPSHFEAHQKFMQFMDDAEVSSFGRWQWANGFNTALTAVGIDLKKLPTAQPEPKEGHWIKHETPDGGEQYECSRCGVLWEFNDGTPEDNEAYFCPKCGKKMKGERQK